MHQCHPLLILRPFYREIHHPQLAIKIHPCTLLLSQSDGKDLLQFMDALDLCAELSIQSNGRPSMYFIKNIANVYNNFIDNLQA